MYSDSHSHLDEHPEGQLASILEQAAAKAVELVVGVATTLEAAETTIDLSRRFPSIVPTVGIHPWMAIPLDVETSSKLRKLAGTKGVAAIGEVGIDLERQPTTGELQWEVLRAQVNLARELGLPLILHCRGARDEMLDLLRGQAPVKGVLHGFTGGPEEARAWMDLGLHIGIGLRAFTRNPSSHLEQTVRAIPLDRMLLETDSSSRSYASEENLHPGRVVDVAERVARIKGTPPEEVGRRTTANLRAMLGI